MALAARLQHTTYSSYVLLGEGDLDEGQTWEAVMAAARFRPERLVSLIDYSKVQLDGPRQHIMPLDPLPEKFRAFNWNVAPDLYDGHSIAAILDSLDRVSRQTQWPVAVIYATCKGRGVSFMESNAYRHGSPIDEASCARGRPELLKTPEELEAKL